MRTLFAFLLVIGICVVPTLADDLVAIKGRVILHKDNTIPKREAIVPDKDKDVCAKDKDFFREDWVIDAKTRGIRDVVIYIVSEPTDEQAKLIEKDKAKAKVELAFDPKKIPEKLKSPPTEPVVFHNQCCRYIPHVAVARVGQTVVLTTNSPTTHKTIWTSQNNQNFTLVHCVDSKKRTLIADLQPERHMITLFCTIHWWMKAHLKVVDTPYYAVTNEKGEFTIKDIPKGKCRLVYFHPEGGWIGGPMGRFGHPIEIKGGEVPDVEYKIEKDEKK